MLLLTLIPLLLGWALATVVLKRRNWLAVAPLTIALALALTLMGVNAFYLHLPLHVSLFWGILLQAPVAVCLLIYRYYRERREPVSDPLPPPGRWCLACLAVIAILVLVYSNAQQIAAPDDDYWIHTAHQGLIRNDNFPPYNPFFSDIPMGGHYGRNLSIVIGSVLFDTNIFLVQHFHTSGCQLLSLLLFFGAFRLSTERDSAALLATIFVYFGLNVGWRGGVIDTIQNNNPFVHLYLSLLLYLSIWMWKRGTVSVMILTGLILGSYAIVYETHFGLVFLTLGSASLVLVLAKRLPASRLALALGALIISLPIALTQGGPLTDMATKKLSGSPESQLLPRGMANQAQVVSIAFPKKELFAIQLQTGDYQRSSYIYQLDTPLKIFHKSSPDSGYAYIWSWEVLRIHFLPLYLFWFSLLVLWRSGSLAGFFMGAFATIAYLVPALVNFGPIYEGEYYRWEFAAALGFAACLGLALADWVESSEQQRAHVVIGQKRIWMNRRARRVLLVIALTLLNSLASWNLIAPRISKALEQGPRAWLYFPRSRDWLASHPVLDFTDLDWRAGRWLSDRAEPGDRLLVNFPDENNHSIHYEGSLVGVSGMRCVGHALPLEDEVAATTPYHRSAATELFWERYDPASLAALQVDWILYRSSSGEELPPIPGVTLRHRLEEEGDQRLLYEVNRGAFPPLRLEDPSSIASLGVIGRASVGEGPLRGGRATEVTTEIDSEHLPGTLVLTSRRDNGEFDLSQTLHLWVDQPRSVVGFVPPYENGEYDLVAYFLPDRGGSYELMGQAFEVGFNRLLEEIEITETTFDGVLLAQAEPLHTDRLIELRSVLSLPPDLPWPREVQASWAFYDLERQSFATSPLENLVDIVVGEEIALPALTPSRPGLYRLSLYLSPRLGFLYRLPAANVTVEVAP